MKPLADSGRLEDLALPDLLTSICGRQEIGLLHLSRHGISKAIYIDHGRIVFATSSDPDDRLGELLLRRGILRAQHLEKALSSLGKPKRLGAILVDMGYLKPADLIFGVIQQVKEIVFGLFLWFDGEYRFERGALPSKEVVTLKLSTPEVILGGISHIDRWWRVLRGVGGFDALYRVSARCQDLLAQIQLTPSQTALLQALEQPTSVRDLCALGILPDFEACTTLWAFRVIGFAEDLSPATAADSPLLAMLAEESTPPSCVASRASSAAVAVEAPSEAPGGIDLSEARPAASAAGPASGSAAASGAPGQSASPEGASRAGSAESKVPTRLDESLVRISVLAFNDRHQKLFALLRDSLADKADAVVRRSMKSIQNQLPGLFKGMEPGPDGAFDALALQANIIDSGLFGFAAALDLVIETELEAVAGLLGPADRRKMVSSLKPTAGV